jgi:membrane fusion protein, heavy metal efflux system
MHYSKFIFASTLLAAIHLNASNEADFPVTPQVEILQLSPEQIATAQIEITKVTPVVLRQTFSLPAKITVNELRQAVIVAKAPGIVTQVSKNIGDSVNVDDVLAVLESKEMAEAKATYITAQKREALTSKTLASEEMLKEKKISSEQDYLHAVLAAEEAKINSEVAMQQLCLLGMTLSDIRFLNQSGMNGLCCYQVKSPLKGVIIEKNIALGSHVGVDQEVYKIADLDTVWVEMGIYANNLNQIKPGHTIYLKPIKGDYPTAEAEITHVSPIIDEHTRTATGIALLHNKSGEWYPGSYVRAEIVTDETSVPLAVLKDAVQEIEGKFFVFVHHPEGFEKREVKTGKSDNNYVQIVEGLEVNTPYAATNAFLLKAEDGKKDAEL